MAAVIALFFTALPAHPGESEPRSYVNTPVGVNFLLVGYSYPKGGLSTAASVPIEDAQLDMHSKCLTYTRSLDVWDKSGKIDVILPYFQLSGSAELAGQTHTCHVTGLNAPRLRFSINFYGAPAMSVQEFANDQQDLIIGASLQASLPVGQYDSDKLVTLGNKRWFVKPNIGISKAWGPFTLGLSPGVIFFTENDDYFGGSTLDQDPLYTTQLNAEYSFGHGILVALSGTWDYGGRTTVDSVKIDDLNNN